MAGFGDVVVVGAFPEVKVVAAVASVKSSDFWSDMSGMVAVGAWWRR